MMMKKLFYKIASFSLTLEKKTINYYEYKVTQKWGI